MEAKVESVRPAGIIASVFGAVTGFIPGSHISTVSPSERPLLSQFVQDEDDAIVPHY